MPKGECFAWPKKAAAQSTRRPTFRMRADTQAAQGFRYQSKCGQPVIFQLQRFHSQKRAPKAGAVAPLAPRRRAPSTTQKRYDKAISQPALHLFQTVTS